MDIILLVHSGDILLDNFEVHTVEKYKGITTEHHNGDYIYTAGYLYISSGMMLINSDYDFEELNNNNTTCTTIYKRLRDVILIYNRDRKIDSIEL